MLQAYFARTEETYLYSLAVVSKLAPIAKSTGVARAYWQLTQRN